MAKSIQQYYDELIAEKQSFSSLNGLTPVSETNQQLLQDLSSTSKVSVWRLMMWIFAFGSWVIDSLFDRHKAEVNEIVANAIPGTAKWLRAEIFKFQYGDSLQWIDNKYQYAVIDATKQIVKYCAVIEVGGQVRIKVAKDNNGQPTPLTSAELTALTDYVNQIKFAGTNSAVTSNAADKLKLALKIYYDPQVLNPDGTLISDGTTKPVENAVNDYLNNLPFNGTLYVNRLTDTIQAAQGVEEPYITTIEATYGNLPYQPVTESYQADAGYIVIDPNYPLSNNITYIANV